MTFPSARRVHDGVKLSMRTFVLLLTVSQGGCPLDGHVATVLQWLRSFQFSAPYFLSSTYFLSNRFWYFMGGRPVFSTLCFGLCAFVSVRYGLTAVKAPYLSLSLSRPNGEDPARLRRAGRDRGLKGSTPGHRVGSLYQAHFRVWKLEAVTERFLEASVNLPEASSVNNLPEEASLNLPEEASLNLPEASVKLP